MNAKRKFLVVVLAGLVFSCIACSESDVRSDRIDYVKSLLNHDQRQIAKVVHAFFNHLLSLEINKANLLIAKTSPMRFKTEDHAKWNEEVGKNEARKQEIRDVLKDSQLYWDDIMVDPNGTAIFRYPPNPSVDPYGIKSGCSVQLIRVGDNWKINTWNYYGG
ncbi:MAG: hypothetical protein ACYS8W_20280 [Planctomycetota bacterium]|jgi:hypothetical protein